MPFRFGEGGRSVITGALVNDEAPLNARLKPPLCKTEERELVSDATEPAKECCLFDEPFVKGIRLTGLEIVDGFVQGPGCALDNVFDLKDPDPIRLMGFPPRVVCCDDVV